MENAERDGITGLAARADLASRAGLAAPADPAPRADLASRADASTLACACDLHALTREERAEHQRLVEQLTSTSIERTEVRGGVRLTFAFERSVPTRLWRFVELERRCCPFLRFTVELPAGSESLHLTLAGEGEARTVIREELGW